jgi:hypothetical protein
MSGNLPPGRTQRELTPEEAAAEPPPETPEEAAAEAEYWWHQQAACLDAANKIIAEQVAAIAAMHSALHEILALLEWDDKATRVWGREARRIAAIDIARRAIKEATP